MGSDPAVPEISQGWIDPPDATLESRKDRPESLLIFKKKSTRDVLIPDSPFINI